MYLLKVHRLLIASGIALCVLYTVVQVLHYSRSNAVSALVQALVAFALAVALVWYFRSIRTH